MEEFRYETSIQFEFDLLDRTFETYYIAVNLFSKKFEFVDTYAAEGSIISKFKFKENTLFLSIDKDIMITIVSIDPKVYSEELVNTVRKLELELTH